MTRYYQEPDGDYLVIAPENGVRFEQGECIYEGRATAIGGSPASICTTGISESFLAKCKRVSKRSVPSEWMRRFYPAT
jgi:predicted ATP-grasp superfamily ATP-dependent carboligase